MSERESVIVVGAGVIGLATALFLVREGFRVQLVEQGALSKKALGEVPTTRVLALNPASIAVFKELEAWPFVKSARFQEYDQMRVVDARSLGEISFAASDVLSNRLGIIVEEQVLKNALLSALESFAHFECIEHSQVEALSQQEGGVFLHCGGQRLKAKALFAADGANSSIRKQLGIFERRQAYGHKSIVCTIEHRAPHHKTARQVFSEEGPLAFLPLFDEHLSSIVWSVPPQKEEELMGLEDSYFIQQLNKAFLGQEEVVGLKSRRMSFPLVKRHARDYHQGQVVLLGDAICGIHPLAGQGMNLGFRELRQLMSLRKEQANSFLTEKTFAKYSKNCRFHNQAMLASMDFFKSFFSRNNRLPKALVAGGLKALTNFKPLKKQLIKLACGEN